VNRGRHLLKIEILLISLCYVIGISYTQSNAKITHEQQRLSRVVDTCVSLGSEGDLNLSNHETLALEDREYILTELIVAEGDSSIVVKNATLILVPVDTTGLSIELKERARLDLIDSTVVFNRTVGDCQIRLEGESWASINSSRIKGRGYVIGHDTASISASGSHVGDDFPSYQSPGIASYGTSTVAVENSIVDGIYVWENSTAFVDASKVAKIRTAWTESDRTVVNITNCRIGIIETWGGSPCLHVNNSTIESASYFNYNTYAWLEDCTISTVRATGNATIWLVDCPTVQIEAEDNARVFIRLYFPVLGLVGVSYSWIPILKAATIAVIIIGLGAISYSVYLKKKIDQYSFSGTVKKTNPT
jgi:hypothetical protein